MSVATAPLYELEPSAGPGARTVPENWDPRHERNFESIWLTHLLAHFGRWTHASDVWEPRDAWQRIVLRQRAHEVVHSARRLGLIVQADPLLGYRVVGHAELPKYVHVVKPDREDEPCLGQMRLET